jgi:hypothetical protein
MVYYIDRCEFVKEKHLPTIYLDGKMFDWNFPRI